MAVLLKGLLLGLGLGLGGDCERPVHRSDLDVVYMERNGWFAPYSCRAVGSAGDVDIEHMVAWKVARDSGLSCSVGKEFVDDMDNITVAYPRVNRVEKGAKSVVDWLPEHNACWYADRYEAVKEKYGLVIGEGERRVLDGVFEGCTAEERAAPLCGGVG